MVIDVCFMLKNYWVSTASLANWLKSPTYNWITLGSNTRGGNFSTFRLAGRLTPSSGRLQWSAATDSNGRPPPMVNRVEPPAQGWIVK